MLVNNFDQTLTQTPELVNQSALGDGWFIKVKVGSECAQEHPRVTEFVF